MALMPEEIDGLRELILAVYGPVTEELLRDLCRCITAAGQISSGDEYKLLAGKKPCRSGRCDRGHAAQADGPHRRRGGAADALGRREDRAAGGKRKPAEHCRSLCKGDAQRKWPTCWASWPRRMWTAGCILLKMYTGARWTMCSGKYPAARRRRRRPCGVPRCACGSAASAPSTARTAHFFRGVHGTPGDHVQNGRDDGGHQREASR